MFPDNLALGLGDGNDEDKDDSENDGESSGIAPLSGCVEGSVHDANAARCKGKQPCRDSLVLAASG
jgi:hypothetical protein